MYIQLQIDGKMMNIPRNRDNKDERFISNMTVLQLNILHA